MSLPDSVLVEIFRGVLCTIDRSHEAVGVYLRDLCRIRCSCARFNEPIIERAQPALSVGLVACGNTITRSLLTAYIFGMEDDRISRLVQRGLASLQRLQDIYQTRYPPFVCSFGGAMSPKLVDEHLKRFALDTMLLARPAERGSSFDRVLHVRSNRHAPIRQHHASLQVMEWAYRRGDDLCFTFLWSWTNRLPPMEVEMSVLLRFDDLSNAGVRACDTLHFDSLANDRVMEHHPDAYRTCELAARIIEIADQFLNSGHSVISTGESLYSQVRTLLMVTKNVLRDSHGMTPTMEKALSFGM